MLTHRRLARDAGVSLASTTYYFPKKPDIVAAVSELLVQGGIAKLITVGRDLTIGRAQAAISAV